MSFKERNVAYDLSLFEDRVADIELSVKSQKNKVVSIDDGRSNRAQTRFKPLNAVMSVVVASLVIVAVVAIIHGQAQLTELNQEINSAQGQLTELESYYTQLNMKVETKLSPSVVEEYAKNELGMSKTESYQKEFISLSEGDKAVVVAEEEKSWWQSLKEAISNIWADRE